MMSNNLIVLYCILVTETFSIAYFVNIDWDYDGYGKVKLSNDQHHVVWHSKFGIEPPRGICIPHQVTLDLA